MTTGRQLAEAYVGKVCRMRLDDLLNHVIAHGLLDCDLTPDHEKSVRYDLNWDATYHRKKGFDENFIVSLPEQIEDYCRAPHSKEA